MDSCTMVIINKCMSTVWLHSLVGAGRNCFISRSPRRFPQVALRFLLKDPCHVWKVWHFPNIEKKLDNWTIWLQSCKSADEITVYLRPDHCGNMWQQYQQEQQQDQHSRRMTKVPSTSFHFGLRCPKTCKTWTFGAPDLPKMCAFLALI